MPYGFRENHHLVIVLSIPTLWAMLRRESAIRCYWTIVYVFFAECQENLRFLGHQAPCGLRPDDLCARNSGPWCREYTA